MVFERVFQLLLLLLDRVVRCVSFNKAGMDEGLTATWHLNTHVG
ncbi:MAG: hypothetical protein WC948_02725 [Thermovirgaceae bacterium]